MRTSLAFAHLAVAFGVQGGQQDCAADGDHASLLMRSVQVSARIGNQDSPWQQTFQDNSKLFEGCSKVFLDVGSNKGTHIRKLFEPEKYPGCPYLKEFDQSFGTSRGGPSSETGICAFGFEANPRWTSRLQEIEKAYAAKGWRAKWFAPAAIGTSTSEITFWNNNKEGLKSIDASFGMIKRYNYSKPVKVPQLDLASFMQELSRHASPGHRLMKLDIEAAEFTVLPKVLEKNLLCQSVLDKLTVEWHERLLPEDQLAAASQLRKQVESLTKCETLDEPSTIVEELDDESFPFDGMPLP